MVLNKLRAVRGDLVEALEQIDIQQEVALEQMKEISLLREMVPLQLQKIYATPRAPAESVGFQMPGTNAPAGN